MRDHRDYHIDTRQLRQRTYPEDTHRSQRPRLEASLGSMVVAMVLSTVVHAQGVSLQPNTSSRDTIPSQGYQESDTLAGRAISLSDAVRLAERRNENVRVARNGVRRAQGQLYRARSELLPQLNATGNYTRTLKSQFAGAFENGTSDTTPPGPPAPAAPCNQYLLDASAPTPDRVTGLELYARCATAASGLDFSSLPFGQANAYTLGLNATQNLFTGGRIAGQIAAANAGRRSAEIELSAQQAQLILDVTEAYYNAALSDRLLEIARSALAQTERILEQTRAQQQVGNISEFELLRATVARDNQRPIVLQRESERDVAYMQLKQLLNIPYEEPLQLTTPIEDSSAVPPGVSLEKVNNPDTVSDHRATVRQASENVEAQRGLLKVARAQRIPTFQLSSAYGGVAYPRGGLPSSQDFRANWTVTLAASFPIFAGGRIRGDEMVAQANLRDAEDRLSQTRKFAALDARVALNTLRQAESILEASKGTVEQAQRAYEIAEIRYREGLSTQLELTDSRNLLEQALANRALATRNVLVARVKLALLPNLPIQSTTATQSVATQQQQQQSQSQYRQTEQPQSQNPAIPSTTGVPGGGF
jgi:outer membrane protein